MNWLKENWRWLIVNAVAVGLFALFFGQAAAASFSAQAMHFLIGGTGNASIIFLLLSLAMTPLQIIFGWRKGQQLKKSTGLWAFVFGMMHLIFYVIEKGAWTAIFGEFFLIIGLIPLLIMLPLAITSTNWWMRTLGKWWKPLHKTVYAAGVTAGLHVALAGNPLLALLMVLLLVVRIPVIRHWFTNRQNANRQTVGNNVPRPQRRTVPTLAPISH